MKQSVLFLIFHQIKSRFGDCQFNSGEDLECYHDYDYQYCCEDVVAWSNKIWYFITDWFHFMLIQFFHVVLSKIEKCKKPSFTFPTLAFESGMQSVHCDSNKSDKVKILGTKKEVTRRERFWSLLKMNLRQTKVLWLSINNQWWKTIYIFNTPKPIFSFREQAIWSLPGVQLKIYIGNFMVC